MRVAPWSGATEEWADARFINTVSLHWDQAACRLFAVLALRQGSSTSTEVSALDFDSRLISLVVDVSLRVPAASLRPFRSLFASASRHALVSRADGSQYLVARGAEQEIGAFSFRHANASVYAAPSGAVGVALLWEVAPRIAHVDPARSGSLSLAHPAAAALGLLCTLLCTWVLALCMDGTGCGVL